MWLAHLRWSQHQRLQLRLRVDHRTWWKTAGAGRKWLVHSGSVVADAMICIYFYLYIYTLISIFIFIFCFDIYTHMHIDRYMIMDMYTVTIPGQVFFFHFGGSGLDAEDWWSAHVKNTSARSKTTNIYIYIYIYIYIFLQNSIWASDWSMSLWMIFSFDDDYHS